MNLSTQEQEIIRLMHLDPDHKILVFKKANKLKWFEPFRLQGYFSMDSLEFDDNANSKFWDVLVYLQKISSQVESDLDIGKDIICILESLVNYSRTVQKINNIHTWIWCVKILIDLPLQVIIENLTIEDSTKETKTTFGFRSWLLTWTDPSYGSVSTDHEIGLELLGRFLASSEEPKSLKFAEAIVDILTRVNIIGELHTSPFKRKAELVCNSYYVCETFKKYNSQLAETSSNSTVISIADNLKRLFEYEGIMRFEYIPFSDYGIRVKISRCLPKAPIKNVVFEADLYKVEIDLYKLRDGTEISIWNLESLEPDESYLVSSEKLKNGTELAQFLLKTPKIPLHIRDNLKTKKTSLERLYTVLSNDYSSVWFASLREGEPEPLTDDSVILVTILRDLILEKCRKDPHKLEEILRLFWSSEYPFSIFKRMVLLCIDEDWPTFESMFESIVTPEIFNDENLQVELFTVLQNHNSDFSTSLIEKITTYIQSIPNHYKQHRSENAWLYMWLSAVSEHPKFQEWYNEVATAIDAKAPYISNRRGVQVRWVRDTSPYSCEAILGFPILVLVEKMREFKDSNEWTDDFTTRGPSKEGFVDELRLAMRTNVQYFIDNLNNFLTAPDYFVWQILVTFDDLLTEKRSFDFKKVFEFSNQYLSTKLQPNSGSKKDGHNEVVSPVIACILRITQKWIGTKKTLDTTNLIDLHERKIVKTIFDSIANFLVPFKRVESSTQNALTYANTTITGNFLHALLTFLLFEKRSELDAKYEIWGISKYDRYFEYGTEADIWFGHYLAQFLWLDEAYSLKKIEEYKELKPDNFLWKEFMVGYLLGAKFPEKPYSLPSIRDQYFSAVDSNFSKEIDNRLVQHIAFGYLKDFEKLKKNNTLKDPSLLWALLFDKKSNKITTRWLELIEYFCQFYLKHRDKDSDFYQIGKRQVLKFWQWVYKNEKKIKTFLKDDYPLLLSRLISLVRFLDCIDSESQKWILRSASFIYIDHSEYRLLKELIRFSDSESINFIGPIMRAMMHVRLPNYEEQNIVLLVERLYEAHQLDDANYICEIYRRRGYEFLRTLWEAHNARG